LGAKPKFFRQKRKAEVRGRLGKQTNVNLRQSPATAKPRGNHMKKIKPNLNEYRRIVDRNEFLRKLLEAIWQHFHETGQWLTLRELYSKHGKAKVREALSNLDGNAVFEERGPGRWKTIHLSLLGALLTKKGRTFHGLLGQFLKFQRKQFQDNPLTVQFTVDDIDAAFKLKGEKSSVLAQLLALGSLGGAFQPSFAWGAQAMDESENFPSTGDLSTEVDKIIFRYHRLGAAIFEEDRQRQAQMFHTQIPSTFTGFQTELGESSLSPANTKRRNTAFIIMWMDKSKPELDDVMQSIKEVCREFKIKAIRADDIEHQNRITDVILQHIAECEFLIADLSGERPNVYYEIGYAHAIGRHPILYRKENTPLHFDLSVHNVPEYRNISDLKDHLRHRFQAILGRKPKTQKEL
jgi:hypothetical protein